MTNQNIAITIGVQKYQFFSDLEYAANDVVYLHKIKSELESMLVREKRIDIFKKCLEFLDTRVELDQKGFKEDIFEH